MQGYDVLIVHASEDYSYAEVLTYAFKRRGLYPYSASITGLLETAEWKHGGLRDRATVVLLSPAFAEESRAHPSVIELFSEIIEGEKFFPVTTGGYPKLYNSPAEMFDKYQPREVFRRDRDLRDFRPHDPTRIPLPAEFFLLPDEFLHLLVDIRRVNSTESSEIRSNKPADMAPLVGTRRYFTGLIMLIGATLLYVVYAYWRGNSRMVPELPRVRVPAVSIPPAYVIDAGLILCATGLALTTIRHALEFMAARRVLRSLISLAASQPPEDAS